jgi:hypothetical protein
MTDTWGVALIVLAAALLLILARSKRKPEPKFRPIQALTRLHRAVGLSVEDGTRVLLALGGASLLTRSVGSALAGLGLLREISQKTSVSDRPPVAVAGEPALALLAQDTLLAGYQAAGAAEYYQPVTGRLAGMTPFSSAAGTIPMLLDEQVSATAMIGHFGVEAALLADSAERSQILVIGGSDDPAGQAALYAAASEALVGEELFAGASYLGGSRMQSAGLTVQDILRWVVITLLLAGAALKLLGGI